MRRQEFALTVGDRIRIFSLAVSGEVLSGGNYWQRARSDSCIELDVRLWGLFGIAHETVPPRRRRGTRCITVQVNESGTGTLVARGYLLEAAAVTRRQ
jgi:hypothetical protein